MLVPSTAREMNWPPSGLETLRMRWEAEFSHLPVEQAEFH